MKKLLPFVMGMFACWVMIAFGHAAMAATPAPDTPKTSTTAATETPAAKTTGDKSTRMADVSVTATRIEREQLKTPAFVDIITPEQMEQLGGFNVYEILKRNGGVNFTSHMPFGLHMGEMSSSIGFRGLKNGELVLLNGLSIMDPSYGYYDIDMIPASFLERIEVVEGAASVLYGSQAETGVINMQLVSPGPQRLTGEVLGGSHTSVQANAVYRNEMVVLGASYSHSDQLTDLRKYYSANAPYNTSVLAWDRAAAMIGVQPWKPLTINYMFNYLKSGWNRDYYKNRSSNYDVDEKSYHHYLLATYKKNQFKVSPYFFYNDFDRDYSYAAQGKPNALSAKKNYTTGFDLQNHNQLGGFGLLYGATYMYESQDDDVEAISGSSSKGYTSSHTISDHHRSQASVFVQGQYDFSDDFLVIGGLRFAGVWPDNDNLEDSYEIVPQIQGLYRLNNYNSLYANIGRGFKAPAFGQLYRDRDNWDPNPDLKPESGWTYEVGWKIEQGRISSTIAAFYMNYEDKLKSQWQPDRQAYMYVNMDKFYSYGVQFKTRIRLMKHLAFNFNGYVANPQEESEGVEVQAGAKYQLTPGLFYDNGVISVALYSEFDLDRERGLPDYTNVHLTAGYKVTEWMKLKVQMDNLLDDKDQVIYGNMTPGNNTIYATYDPGLWIMAGVEIYLDLL